ncbi:MAG: putative DNA binding domain-containing protein [Bacteroidales bacterium]|jgi:ATP-dependent DNA helicase RecG|nr:putative DNA binding domain-containing protein [Bacteroidales bacterium]
MTIEEITKIITQGESISIEFKKAKEKVPASLYETVVSFANTRGGNILLGVDDDGTVLGIPPENKAAFLKNITSALNSKDNINPELYLNPESFDYKGKTIIVIQVPASSQVHNHAGKVYIREYETDIDVTNNQHTIRRLFLKKGGVYTETHIYPGLKMSDMDEALFSKVRNIIRGYNPEHPWLNVDNMQMLRDASLHWNDYENNREGFSLAAALIFGKDLTIQNLLPAYKVEAMVRIKDKDRWDDRLTLRTNLIDTYLKLKEFLYRYLPDKFYLEGDQRVDLRDRIFREVIGNIIVHREYTDATATEVIIEEDAVRTLNPNNPYFNGIMDLDNFNPHPKNPNIRKFFNVLGWTDEIGSGIRNTRKYLPRYVENAAPVFIDQTLFRTIIPLVRYTMSYFADQWFRWLEVDEKWRPKLTESLKNIEIDGKLHKMSWEEQITSLISSWMEKVTKLNKKVTKLNKKEALIQNKIEEKCLSSTEKVTKLPSKRVQYFIDILLLSGSPISVDDLVDILSFNHRTFFNENYLKPLSTLGFIQRTNPDKPTSPNQKYLITEKGKRFLTGKND